MKKLLKEAEIRIDEELEKSSFINDSDTVYRYLDDLAWELAINKILRDNKTLKSYYEKEKEICELTNRLLEAIHISIMPKYNIFEWYKTGVRTRIFYKIDKKFDTLEKCLDFFNINF